MKQILILLVLAISSCLYPQEVPDFAPISKNEWEKCEKFIATQANTLFRQGLLIIAPQEELPFPIEKDPASGYIYIHLKDHPNGFIGQGCNKIITKSILYDKEDAFVVARCEANETGKHEAEILEKMKSIPSISHLYSMIPRENNRYDLFVEYGNKGDLGQSSKGKLRLSMKDLISVLLDLNSAIKGMHERGYIHRDIKQTNAFLYTKKGKYHAMMGDVSFAIPIHAPVADGRFCIPDDNTPPEIYQKPFHLINRIQSETYSLGIIFYALILEKRPRWQQFIIKRIVPGLSPIAKEEQLEQIQHIFERCRKKGLKHLKKKRKKVAKLMFQMVDPNPDNRPSLAFVQKELTHLMK